MLKGSQRAEFSSVAQEDVSQSIQPYRQVNDTRTNITSHNSLPLTSVDWHQVEQTASYEDVCASPPVRINETLEHHE